MAFLTCQRLFSALSIGIIVGMIALLPGMALAEQIVVPDDFPSILEAIEASVVGDSILIMAGTYSELPLDLKSGIFLIGETGNPADVVITGPVSLDYCLSAVDVDSTTVVSGLTFEHRKSTLEMDNSSPSFVNCWFTDSDLAPGLDIRNSSSRFTGCRMFNHTEGAMRIRSSNLVFENCDFDYNSAVHEYTEAAVAYITDESRVVFQNCNLYENGAFASCAGIKSLNGYLEMNACFIRNSWGGTQGAVYLVGESKISHSIFENNRATGFGGHGGSSGHGGALYVSGEALIQDSLFINNHAYDDEHSDGSGGAISARANTIISRCVFYDNHATWGSAVYGPGIMDHCIVAFGSGRAPVYSTSYSGYPSLSCCDIWGNEEGNWVYSIADLIGVDGNISGDPAFCDAQGGVFTVCADSPCLPGVLPEGCDEIIGLFGAGCDPCNPVAVFLSEFSAQRISGGVQLSWFVSEDRSENDFRLMRLEEGNEVSLNIERVAQGHFQGLDLFEADGAGQFQTYRLYLRDQYNQWALLREEKVTISGAPAQHCLGSVAPNPFNPRTRVALNLPQAQTIDLSVYDLQGRKVATLHQGALNSGAHEFEWNGRDQGGKGVSSGSYTLRLVTPNGVESKAMLLLR